MVSNSFLTFSVVSCCHLSYVIVSIRCLLLSFILCYRFYSVSLPIIYPILSFLFVVSSYHISHFIFSIRCLLLSFILCYRFYLLSLPIIYPILSFLFAVPSYRLSYVIFSLPASSFVLFIIANHPRFHPHPISPQHAPTHPPTGAFPPTHPRNTARGLPPEHAHAPTRARPARSASRAEPL
jgi:hypothetical protein